MKRASIALAILILSAYAYAQKEPATPIKAKQRQIMYEIKADGSKIMKHKHEGTFYRSSSGAELDTMDERVNFRDSSGNGYRIIHSKKLAVLEIRGSGPVYQRKKQMIKDVGEHEMVNGFYCAIVPLYVNGELRGKSYNYVPYAIVIRDEFKPPGMDNYLQVNELYSVEVAEPEPSLVRIPKGYSIANETEQ
jgi:hypothetical protein